MGTLNYDAVMAAGVRTPREVKVMCAIARTDGRARTGDLLRGLGDGYRQPLYALKRRGLVEKANAHGWSPWRLTEAGRRCFAGVENL